MKQQSIVGLQQGLLANLLFSILLLVMTIVSCKGIGANWTTSELLVPVFFGATFLVPAISFFRTGWVLLSRLKKTDSIRARRYEWYVVALFLTLQVAAPFAIGELYPFTTSPMFSDQPKQYAVYKVTDKFGEEIDSSCVGLHLVYDGNPPGFGVGVCPLETMHAFGAIADEAEVREHLSRCLKEHAELPDTLVVEQKVVRSIGETLKSEFNRWVISRSDQNSK